ncbi:AAA family ATPase [Rhizobium sp. 32-5/1]|uniref:AAA family ATPase n=1 Tax=Rhizobium sp. 32-5/1 TaxID=3019602 RepID=UPI00240DECCA|nr:AAA family ATPase [Rhizobium sp. 32-5/1]WEZ82197.1 AAA family ATPase [Rhizobium sp. 32-5/1]
MHSAYIQHDGPSAQGNACFGDVVANVPERSPAARDAVAFLQALDLHGWHNVVAIGPNQAPTGRTFPPNSWHEIADWVDRNNAKANCYFSLNEPRPDAPNKKLEKADIARIRGVGVDLDPIKHDDRPLTPSEFAEARAELRSRQLPDAAQFPPSLTIDTGNGLQHIWLAAESIDAGAEGQWAEGCGKALAKALRGDAVQNIDRVLRLPGTVNLLTPKKLMKYPPGNRTASTEVPAAPRRYTQDEIGSLAPLAPRDERDDFDETHTSDETAAIAQALREIGPAPVFTGSFTDLDPSVAERLAIARQRNPMLDSLLEGDPKALRGSRADDTTGSQFLFSLARYLGDAQFSASDFADVACTWPIVFSTLEKAEDAGGTGRALARAWGKAGAPRAAEISVIVAKFFDPNPPVAGGIEWISPTAWHGSTPAPQEWEVENWIPRHEVTLLYGDGGVGKTLLAHQYATAAATGRKWLGQPTRAARVICFFCEDDANELHRRQSAINQSLGLAMDDLTNLRLVSRKHDLNILARWDAKAGELKLTPLWYQLRDGARAFGADVIIIDTLADVYAGNEIDRAQVSAFVKLCLGGLAQAIGGSVIALGHPSQSGKNTGTGTSGSTAWSNAARSRIYLKRPDGPQRKGRNADATPESSGNVRELENMKLNYGPKGSKLKLEWRRGAFVPLGASSPVSSVSAADTDVPDLDDVAERAVAEAIIARGGSGSPNSRTVPTMRPRF